MTKTNATKTNTTKTANTWTFSEGSITVNGKTFPATYSDASASDLGVYVFSKLGELPVRVHIGKDMPEYEACLAIAKAAKQPKARLDGQPAPKAAAPAKQDKPAPEAEQAKAAAPAKQAAQVEKPWIGTAIEGKGWRIAFDEQSQRTRLIFDEQPTDAQKAAIDAAGFFWSAQLQSWNKKLTCKAHRAALELAETLKAIA